MENSNQSAEQPQCGCSGKVGCSQSPSQHFGKTGCEWPNEKLSDGGQALDDAHVSHDLRISAMGTGITVGQFKRMMMDLNISDGARIKFSLGADGWALLGSVSYCRDANEVSLW